MTRLRESRNPKILPELSQSADWQHEHGRRAADGKQLIDFIKAQLETIIISNDIPLGFPIDGRVKDLESIIQKCERKGINLESIDQFDDFVGVRIVLLFKRDLSVFDDFIKSTFIVKEYEDTAQRLSEEAFGYQSAHYIVSLPSNWTKIPSLKNIATMKAEIQVRTISQHMWAAVSHKLQYKIEATVPYELRRSINRASAILELIDIEFDRVLDRRDNYVSSITQEIPGSSALNVDIVRKIMNELLPAENLEGDERHDEIFIELDRLGVKTLDNLKQIIESNIQKAIEQDDEMARDEEAMELTSDLLRERGRYFNQAGIMRKIMQAQFGVEAARDAMGGIEPVFIPDSN